ncbi:MAG: TonB-dependent receptor [Caulobacteraceae bacterium]
MTTHKSRLIASTAILVAGLVLGATAAYGQENTVEEIVVTSQKTAQNVQNVPIAVTAVTAQALQTKGINDVSQLSNLAPNVTLDAGSPFSGSDNVLSAFIRGIGQNDFAFNQDPGVGVYVDGVYLARSAGSNTSMLDVDRVEVLKGPQGTLFGRNTIGGAISIVTREPGSTFMARGEVTTGSYDRLDIRGTMDVPVNDKLLTSLSFSKTYRQGYQRRIPYPGAVSGSSGIPDCDALPTGTQCVTVNDGYTSQPASGYQTSEREGGQNAWSLRGKALFLPSNDLKFTFAADYTHIDQPATANTVSHIDPTYNNPLSGIYNACIAGITAPFGILCTAPRLGLSPVPTPKPPLPALGGVNVDGDPNNNRLPYDSRFETGNIDTTYSTGNSFDKMDNYGMSLTGEWTVAPETTIKSITAYRDLHWRAGMDLDGSPLDQLHTSFNMIQHQFSQELQVVGKQFDDRLDYVLGAYYFREAGHLHDYVTFAGPLLMVDGPNDLATNAEAVFAHLNFKLTDQLAIVAGGRYTWEHKTFVGGQTDDDGLSYKITGCFPPSAPNTLGAPANLNCQQVIGFPNADQPYRYYPEGTFVQDFSDFSPTIGLQYNFTPDVMGYVTYSKGFKTGSWTTRLSNPHPTYDSSLHFGPEHAATEEIGLKTEMFDRRLRLNLAGFHTDYKDIQLNEQQGISPTLVNAGDARIWGAEAEAEAVLGGGLSFSAAAGYTNARYTRIAAGVGDNGNDITLNSCPEYAVLYPYGDPRAYVNHQCSLPKTPKFKFMLSPQYVADLGHAGELQFNLDWTYTTELFNDLGNSIALRRPNTNVVNASVTYRPKDGHWDATVGGTNLTDERYVVSGQWQGGISVVDANYSPPREWYATLRFRY